MKSLKEQLVGSSREIRESRVSNFINILCDQSENMINNLDHSKMEYRKLQMKLESLLDIAPTNITDLASKLTAIDTTKLMSDINQTVKSMYDVAVIVERRVALHNRLFPDSRAEGLSDKELDFLKDLVRPKVNNFILPKQNDDDKEKE